MRQQSGARKPLSQPTAASSPFRGALGKTGSRYRSTNRSIPLGCGRILSAPTGASAKPWDYTIQRSTPPQLRVRSATFNRGMIATGNHNFERFAALCNTPKGEPRALRASGRLRASPTMAVQNIQRTTLPRLRRSGVPFRQWESAASVPALARLAAYLPPEWPSR